MFLYLVLLVFYAVVPPVSQYFTQRLIYRERHKYGWHLHYLAKYLATLSFLPLLFFSDIDIGLMPKNYMSVIFAVLTFLLAILGIQFAIKKKVLVFYIAGITAAFMEEILYRGIIFGLAYAIWNNIWVALTISSIAFGFWHLKNFPWHNNKKKTWIQFTYTALAYGPIFALERILTGDLYLAILHHYITDATCALAPDWMRGWLVRGGKGGIYSDTHNT